MNLENLVPPLELCKRIPAGHFEDSALVWEKNIGLDGTVYEPRINTRKASLVQNILYHAPTLAEIIVALDKAGYWCPTCFYRRGIWHIDCEDRTIMDAEDKENPATAALKLWLELEAKTKTKGEESK
jgi:hypothetical protein